MNEKIKQEIKRNVDIIVKDDDDNDLLSDPFQQTHCGGLAKKLFFPKKNQIPIAEMIVSFQCVFV